MADPGAASCVVGAASAAAPTAAPAVSPACLGGEPGFSELLEALKALPPEQRRAVQSMLGLSIGDAAGLPFELRKGSKTRPRFRAMRSEFEREAYAKSLVLERVERSPYFRTYSDDTACCDLKMSAA